MSEPAEVMATLDRLAQEVDQRSSQLANTERKLEPVEDRYQDGYEDFIAGLFDDQEKRLPGEDVRRALYHRDLRQRDASLLGEYRNLSRKRKRLEKRIGSLKAAVDAQRSILSALKTEMEAVSR